MILLVFLLSWLTASLCFALSDLLNFVCLLFCARVCVLHILGGETCTINSFWGPLKLLVSIISNSKAIHNSNNICAKIIIIIINNEHKVKLCAGTADPFYVLVFCCIYMLVHMTVLRSVEITTRLFIAVMFSWLTAAGTVCHACDSAIMVYTTIKTEENTLSAKLALTLLFGLRRFTQPALFPQNLSLLAMCRMHLSSLKRPP